MLQKVQNHGKLSWVESGESLRHEGISKSAMDSFAQEIAKQAKKMKSTGSTYEEIAAKCNLKVDTLKSIIAEYSSQEEEVKLASCDKCDSRSIEAREKGEYLSEAEKAYEALRGNKSASVIPKDFVPMNKRISSARGRTDVTDIGGPKRQVNSSLSYDRAMEMPDNGERIRETNKRIAAQREENKQASRYQTIDGKSLKEQLKSVDLRKDAGVHSISGRESVNYSQKIPVSGMSIFDTPTFGGKGDFSHIEKTEGETIGDRRKAEAAEKKKNSRTWVEDAKNRQASSTANSVFGKMIDSLVTGK